MTDFLLALASLAGLLAYATVGVAHYKLTTRLEDVEWWETAGLSVTVPLVFTAVLLALIQNTAGQPTPLWVQLWGVVGGIAMIVGTIAPWFGGDTPEVFYAFRSIVWPVAVPLGWVLRATVAIVVGASRGPLAWGTWLSSLPTRRADRRRAQAKELAARAYRIAELERELGLTSTPSSALLSSSATINDLRARHVKAVDTS